MDRLIRKLTATFSLTRALKLYTRWIWNARQYCHFSTRTFGVWEWGLMAAGMISLASIASMEYLRTQISSMQSSQTPSTAKSHSQQENDSAPTDAEQRLSDFEKILIPHEKIPQALGDLLRLAEDEGLLVRRADYRPEEGESDQFMSYRIQMPINGTTESIQRLLRKALQSHRNLILASVKLNRKSAQSDDLEANVQWVFLSQRPAATPTPAKGPQ